MLSTANSHLANVWIYFDRGIVLHSQCSCMTQPYNLEICLSCCPSNLPPHRQNSSDFSHKNQYSIIHIGSQSTCPFVHGLLSQHWLLEKCTLLCVGGSFLFTDKISSILIAYHILFIVLLL